MGAEDVDLSGCIIIILVIHHTNNHKDAQLQKKPKLMG